MTTPDSFPCPSCGFLVFSAPTGSYDICPLCGWEDDPVQLAHPLLQGGANRQCLAQSQIAALAKWPVEIRECNGISRDSRWRPLKEEELTVKLDAPRDGQTYFEAAAEISGYYWLSDEKP